MSLQGSIIVVTASPSGELVQALTAAGAFPVIETRLAEAPAAVASIKPSAVVIAGPTAFDPDTARSLERQIAKGETILPVLAQVTADSTTPFPDALPIAADAPVQQLVARLAAALRLRALHATVIGRAKALETDRNIVAELPHRGAVEEATVLLIGRGRSHPALGVAIGERMGVMGALSVDFAARCLNARDIDGIVVGDGLPPRSVEAFLTVLSEDARFRDLPVALLGTPKPSDNPVNVVRCPDPQLLIERLVPLVRMHAFENALKRLLKSIESKGMHDAETGLLSIDAFGRELTRAIDDTCERGVRFSLARFSFEAEIGRRSSIGAARLLSRLIRGADFACREDDGSILTAFVDTDLRHAHVVEWRLASVLRHTMLRPGREKGRDRTEDRTQITPTVTLATLKPDDTVLTLLARVAPQRLAAE